MTISDFINIDFLRFYLYIFSLVLVLIEKIYQKHLEVRQKYSAPRRITPYYLKNHACLSPLWLTNISLRDLNDHPFTQNTK